MSLLPAAAFPGLRSALEITLTHTCTMTPIRAGAEDQHYDATSVPGDPIPNIPCRFETIQRATRDENGVTLVSVSTLSASATGPIKVGVQVTAVMDQLGTVLSAGPLRVERVLDDTAGLGSALLPVYELRAADTELS